MTLLKYISAQPIHSPESRVLEWVIQNAETKTLREEVGEEATGMYDLTGGMRRLC